MARPPQPPRLARVLTSLTLRGDAREVIVGDLDQEFADAIAAGGSRRVARRLYWRQTIASIAAVRHDAWAHRRLESSGGLRWLRGLSLDLRSIARALRRSPGYAVIAILSLAIGIGANTTIFSVVRQLFLMPLPVDRPDDLRLVYWSPHVEGPLGISNISASTFTDAAGTSYRSNFSYPQFSAMRRASASLDLAAYNFLRRLTVSAEGHAPLVTSGMLTSGNYFSVIRPPLVLGRGLIDADDEAGAPPVAVISYGLWTQFFGNDPNVRGKTIQVNDVVFEIVGVTSASYRGLSQGGFLPPTDVTMAMAHQPAISPEWNSPRLSLFTAPGVFWVRLIARDGNSSATPPDALHAAFAGQLPGSGLKQEVVKSATLAYLPGAHGLDSLRTSARLPLQILTIVSGVVLLIACINVAGLMLARGVARQRELAIRRALGAGRGRIMRELLLEGVILSAIGGTAGLLAALWTAPVLQSMLTSGLGTSGISVTLDWPLIGTTAALGCTAGVLAGLLPALRFSSNQDVLLNQRSAAGAPALRIGRALLALQIAVSLPLVVGATLFLRTLHNLATVDLGFEPRGLTLFNVDPTMNGKRPEGTERILPVLLERLEAIPGVTSATFLENALVSGSESDTTVVIDGRDQFVYMNSVGPHYLETMSIRLIAGRTLLASDVSGQPPVVLINETAAAKYFPNRSPLGGHITNASRELTVVGIVSDSKYDGLRNAVAPILLHSYLQRPVGPMTVAVRATVPAAALRAAIDSAVRDVDRKLPITQYKTQIEQIDQTIGKERVIASLLTVFGAFALLLACVGLHGVTSYSVARRTSEIGIRLALGAQRSQVLWLVLRQVVVLSAAGLAIGLPIAWISSPIMGSFLFGLDPRDPLTIGVAAFVMVAVAVGAGLRPARRAARLEALSALRSE